MVESIKFKYSQIHMFDQEAGKGSITNPVRPLWRNIGYITTNQYCVGETQAPLTRLVTKASHTRLGFPPHSSQHTHNSLSILGIISLKIYNVRLEGGNNAITVQSG